MVGWKDGLMDDDCWIIGWMGVWIEDGSMDERVCGAFIRPF